MRHSRRPRHGRGGPRPLPGHAARHRAGDRRRVLLRLQAAPPADPGGPRRDRGADGRQRRRGPPVRPPRAVAGRGAGASSSSATSRSRSRSSTTSPRRPRPTARRCRRSRSTSTGRSVDLCKGPHVASHRQDRAVQAPRPRRRVLARRREAADAPAHLRHGLGERQEELDAVPVAARARRRSATIAGSASSSTCTASTT